MSSETKPLKRFRNLDIDGVQRPARPQSAPASRPHDSRPGGAATSRATAPSRASGGVARPSAPPPPEPPPRRANVPDQPASVPSGMIREAFRIDLRGGATAPARAAAPQPLMRRGPEPLPPGTRSGVVTVEMGRPQRALRTPFAPPEPAPVRSRSVGFAPPASHGVEAPIELTEVAARQIRLMAYHHGVLGAGLRIVTSGPGGPGHCDFAFENEPDPDDVVFLSQGIRVIVDPSSLRTLRGLRVTYQDLPGVEGFRIG